jgi:hypothetical protein
LDLEAIASEGNLLPNKENYGKKKGKCCAQGSRDFPIGLSRLEQSRE